jgi:hypothetical protein
VLFPNPNSHNIHWRGNESSGYRISTDKTEDLFEEVLDQFIKLYDSM